MFIIKWLSSKTVRQATDMRRHVERIARAQVDVISPQAYDAVAKVCADLKKLVAESADKKALLAGMDELEKVANKSLKPYPAAGIRENVEVFLVAIAVAMAIRTFFLQPFKIPTGSMQPTLYGITQEDLRGKPDVKIPTGLQNIYESFFLGTSYYHVVAKTDGSLDRVDRPVSLKLINLWQTFYVGGQPYTVWFPPDDFLSRAGVTYSQTFKAGDDIIKAKIKSGDHLFVDRLTYNFRHPKRGEIIVFETDGIAGLPPAQFYIKRLVALGGEKVQIGNDRHLIIDAKRLDASTKYFENVYSFSGPPEQDHYSGHVNEETSRKYNRSLAPNFSTAQTVFDVRPYHYLVMGDNTMNSSDSRTWGDFSETNVIGKAFCVYWPFTDRFGWTHMAHR